jgi:DNA-binding PadR family transcriptional regulator
MTEDEKTLLRLLSSCSEPMYGLDLIKRSDGALRRGTVYVALQSLEEEALVSSREEKNVPPHIGIARRLYTITSRGRYVALSLTHE